MSKEKELKKEYQRVLDKILKAIDGEDVDDVVPALVTTLSCISHLHNIPKTTMLSFVADAFDITDEEGVR